MHKCRTRRTNAGHIPIEGTGGAVTGTAAMRAPSSVSGPEDQLSAASHAEACAALTGAARRNTEPGVRSQMQHRSASHHRLVSATQGAATASVADDDPPPPPPQHLRAPLSGPDIDHRHRRHRHRTPARPHPRLERRPRQPPSTRQRQLHRLMRYPQTSALSRASDSPGDPLLCPVRVTPSAGPVI